MKKTFQLIITAGFLIIFGTLANALVFMTGFIESDEVFDKGDKVYSKSTSHFACANYDRLKARLKIDIMLDVAGCEIVDFAHSGFLIGKVRKVKDTTIKFKGRDKAVTRQLVQVKTRQGKKWFSAASLTTKKANKKKAEKSIMVDWFFANAEIGKTFNSELWEKNLGKFEVLEVTKLNYHEAYYFPSVNKTVAVNILRNDRISYTRNGKNPN